MHLTDRMIAAQNRKRIEGERRTDFQQDDADEMGYAYKPKPPFEFFNQSKGAFVYEDKTSINTAPSVFEKTTIFHASKTTEDDIGRQMKGKYHGRYEYDNE